jgi:hypothetical protein
MVVAQHAEEIELDMLVLENQILFATVNLLVASCGWHFVKQGVLKCFDNCVGTHRCGFRTHQRQRLEQPARPWR